MSKTIEELEDEYQEAQDTIDRLDIETVKMDAFFEERKRLHACVLRFIEDLEQQFKNQSEVERQFLDALPGKRLEYREHTMNVRELRKQLVEMLTSR